MESPLGSLGKIIVFIGGMLVLFGLVFMFLPKVPLVGRLPGDFHWKVGSAHIYIPLASCIILSLALTLILNIVFRLFK